MVAATGPAGSYVFRSPASIAVAEPAPGRLDHRLARVDAAVVHAEPEQVLAEAAVAAREVEDDVARREPRPERDDELGAVSEVGVRVRVGRLGPALRLRVVLLRAAHSARSRSGCLRTKRRIPPQCQSVRRSRKRRSLARSYACVTTAPGTYHRSQPAFAAR